GRAAGAPGRSRRGAPGCVRPRRGRGDPLGGEALDGETPVVVQSELVANEKLPVTEDDPRAAAALESPLRSEFFRDSDTRAVLEHSTRASRLTIAAAMDHVIEGPPGTTSNAESFEHLARLLVTADLVPGEPLRVVKFVTYGWSSQ